MLSIIPDTNVLLHCQELGLIDIAALGVEEECRWLITENVLWEIDEKKWSASKRLRRRAKEQIAQIERASDEGALSNGVPLVVYHRSRTDYVGHNLDAARPDHRIIADIVDYREQNPNDSIVVLTADLTMKCAVMARGFRAMKPPKALLLPEQRDESEIEAEILRKRLAEL